MRAKFQIPLVALMLCLVAIPAGASSLFEKVKNCSFTLDHDFFSQSLGNESKEEAANEAFALLVDDVHKYILNETVEVCDLTVSESIDLLYASDAGLETYNFAEDILNSPVDIGLYEMDGKFIIRLTVNYSADALNYFKDAIILPEDYWSQLDQDSQSLN